MTSNAEIAADLHPLLDLRKLKPLRHALDLLAVPILDRLAVGVPYLRLSGVGELVAVGVCRIAEPAFPRQVVGAQDRKLQLLQERRAVGRTGAVGSEGEK
jgi:hypothetical protein